MKFLENWGNYRQLPDFQTDQNRSKNIKNLPDPPVGAAGKAGKSGTCHPRYKCLWSLMEQRTASKCPTMPDWRLSLHRGAATQMRRPQ